MLFHFSCSYEKVSKQSTKNILTRELNGDKKVIMRDKMAVGPCRSGSSSLFWIILNCSLAMKQAEFFYSGCCFG